MGKFKYLGITVTYQTCIHEEIKGRLNLRKSGCHSRILSSHFISEKLNIKTHKTIIFTCYFVEDVRHDLSQQGKNKY
jgi:hypothetical protein